MGFLSFFFGNHRESSTLCQSHDLEITFVNNNSILKFSTTNGHSLNEIKEYIVNNSDAICFIRHKTISSNGDTSFYTKGIFTIDSKTNMMKPKREKALTQSDINFVIGRLN